MASPVPLLARKRDLAYFTFFVIHLPIMFLVDFQALYPKHLIPDFMRALNSWYITTYKDQFFAAPSPPPFFALFMYLEVLMHVPLCLWCIGGLYNNCAHMPIFLFAYGCETFLTTLVCIVEYLAWDVSVADKINLTTLYGPYLLLSVYMLVDNFIRIYTALGRLSVLEKTVEDKKTQ